MKKVSRTLDKSTFDQICNFPQQQRATTGHFLLPQVAKTIVEQDLSLIIFPEGTRSPNGRLLPFKKGAVHLAIQSKRPIVPMVLTGTHLAWRKSSLHVRPAPLTVTYLPPIRTDDWTLDKVDEYVELLHSIYVKNLPDSQTPLS
eukprot:TRINITY_DN15871_c0_g2_i8.p1 TRINITY_DN15871_c0_g2~~TRINITY_DN15871_c0_g2_i8.p1  ORF type:complete len:144 (+),score=19.98 TRINITY_DN15871_c0_g2_i8:221-652(+)